jgi:hypothetical protein
MQPSFDYRGVHVAPRFDPMVLSTLSAKQLSAMVRHMPPAVISTEIIPTLALLNIPSTSCLNHVELGLVQLALNRLGKSSVRTYFTDDLVLSAGDAVVITGTYRPSAPQTTASASSASSNQPASLPAVPVTVDDVAFRVEDGTHLAIAPIPLTKNGSNMRPGTQNIVILDLCR